MAVAAHVERQLSDHGVVVGVNLDRPRVEQNVGRVFGILDCNALEVCVAVDLHVRSEAPNETCRSA